jgi:hypothetical protein
MKRQMIECRRKDLTMMYGSVTYKVPFGIHPMDEAFRDDCGSPLPDSTALSWHAVHKFSDIRLKGKERTWFVRTFAEEAPSATDIVLESIREGVVPEGSLASFRGL